MEVLVHPSPQNPMVGVGCPPHDPSRPPRSNGESKTKKYIAGLHIAAQHARVTVTPFEGYAARKGVHVHLGEHAANASGSCRLQHAATPRPQSHVLCKCHRRPKTVLLCLAKWHTLACHKGLGGSTFSCCGTAHQHLAGLALPITTTPYPHVVWLQQLTTCGVVWCVGATPQGIRALPCVGASPSFVWGNVAHALGGAIAKPKFS